MNWKLINKITLPFVVAMLLAVFADILIVSFVDFGHKSNEFSGCNAYDAMLIGFECKGFSASNIISLWLNWPLWLIYAPLFALFSIRAFAVAILVWLPVVVYIVSLIRLWNQKNVEPAAPPNKKGISG